MLSIIYLVLCLYYPNLIANSVALDKVCMFMDLKLLCSAASDLGVHYLLRPTCQISW